MGSHVWKNKQVCFSKKDIPIEPNEIPLGRPAMWGLK